MPVKTAVISGGELVGPANGRVAEVRRHRIELEAKRGTGHILRERYRPGHRGRSQAAHVAGAEIGLSALGDDLHQAGARAVAVEHMRRRFPLQPDRRRPQNR